MCLWRYPVPQLIINPIRYLLNPTGIGKITSQLGLGNLYSSRFGILFQSIKEIHHIPYCFELNEFLVGNDDAIIVFKTHQ